MVLLFLLLQYLHRRGTSMYQIFWTQKLDVGIHARCTAVIQPFFSINERKYTLQHVLKIL
jgi:hypothetical protein